ncbi:MAG TPA: hypothetical protein VK463_14730 [Desulfomonilaceae bacterium]|nr:hypothetical protein [Desulfomonilaceae bacterium]
MDDVQKSKIRMTHWIDHNVDHVRGYKEVAETLDKFGHSAAAEKIRRGISLIEAANDAFESAMIDLPGSDTGHSQGMSHTHSHEHHDHSHDHAHESHDHSHPHVKHE